MKIAKHDMMRNTNTLSILDCIRRYGPIAKKQIQTYTGLSWGAISSISAYLLDKKVISEFKSTKTLIGRIPSMYEINNNDNLIIGIDINFEGLVAVLIDLKCSVIKVIHKNIESDEKDDVIRQAKTIVYTLIKAGIDPKMILFFSCDEPILFSEGTTISDLLTIYENQILHQQFEEIGREPYIRHYTTKSPEMHYYQYFQGFMTFRITSDIACLESELLQWNHTIN